MARKKKGFAKNASGGSLKFRDLYISGSLASQEYANASRVKPDKVDSEFLQDCNAIAARWAARKKK